MYNQLIQVAAEVQKVTSRAFNERPDEQYLAWYYVAVTDLTARFFQKVIPPEGLKSLHQSFVDFLDTASKTVSQQLEGPPGNADATELFVGASRRFIAEMEQFQTESADPVEVQPLPD